MNLRPSTRTAVLLLVLLPILQIATLVILGAAINWPDSLDQPASIVLPLISQQADGTRLGYSVYLLYSVLFFPAIYLTARIAAREESLRSPLTLAVGFAALSTLARTIGIIRWLVAMPALATAYVNGDPAAQTAIAVSYETLNAFGGSVGEVLGVAIFAALAVGLLSVVILREGTLPRWLGVWGVVAAVSQLVPLAEAYGLDLGPLVTIGVGVMEFWFWAAAAVLLTRRSPTPSRITAAQAA